MYCGKCGKKIESTAGVCYSCETHGERGWKKVADATAFNRAKHNAGLRDGLCNEEPLEWTGITWANARMNDLEAKNASLRAEMDRLDSQLASTRADLHEGFRTVGKLQDENDRLRAGVEDVEGMARVISSLDPVKNTETGAVCSWDDLTDRYRELYRKDATALSRWLKEGK